MNKPKQQKSYCALPIIEIKRTSSTSKKQIYFDNLLMKLPGPTLIVL